MKTQFFTGSILSLLLATTQVAAADEKITQQAMLDLNQSVQQSVQQDIEANVKAQLQAMVTKEQSKLLLARLVSMQTINQQETQIIN